MNVLAIYREMARRLSVVVRDIYDRPSSSPVYPSGILAIPTIETYHVDHAHTLARLNTTLRMLAGRGDTDTGLELVMQWMSTDTPNSVERALTNKVGTSDPAPFHRLEVSSAGDLRTDADSISVTFNINIDA